MFNNMGNYFVMAQNCTKVVENINRYCYVGLVLVPQLTITYCLTMACLQYLVGVEHYNRSEPYIRMNFFFFAKNLLSFEKCGIFGIVLRPA